MSLCYGTRILTLFALVGWFGLSPTEAFAKKRPRKPASSSEGPAFTEEHYKSFSMIARTWSDKGCDKEVPRQTKNAIEKACNEVRTNKMLYRPKLVKASGDIYVQCLLASEVGFLEVTLGAKKNGKLVPNRGVAEFKLDPKGSLYAIAQDGFAVGAGYCEELEEEVTTRKSVMGYSTFQALFINQYSPGKRLTVDQFFGQIAKVNLCYQHHPNFSNFRCTKYFAKQKKMARDVAAEHQKKKKRGFKHNFNYF